MSNKRSVRSDNLTARFINHQFMEEFTWDVNMPHWFN